MTTVTDYTRFAADYELRPPYIDRAITAALRAATATPGSRACDLGAGTGRLARLLAHDGLDVDAVEPTAAMRKQGIAHTADLLDVTWYDATAEDTGRPSNAYSLVTFGSSFNVVDQPAALRETARLLTAGGYFACCWNHFDLDDPLQIAVEQLIRDRLPSWPTGIVGADPTAVLEQSGLFAAPVHLSAHTVHVGPASTWAAAWRSHWTLQQHAGDAFDAIVAEIDALVRATAGDTVRTAYSTRVWIAQLSPTADTHA